MNPSPTETAIQTAKVDMAIAEGVAWLRELAGTCKAEAVNRFLSDEDEAGEEWRVRGESYAFIANQIEGGYSPFTPKCGDVGVPLCNACSAPITELTQVPGCGAPQ